MRKAIDIANFFVQLSRKLPESDITNLKVNKLCYYAQGYSLAKLGKPLFSDEIQAWKYGPVIPGVYQTYKVCGNNVIAEESESFNEDELDDDELELLTDVFMTYDKYSPIELMNMTHEEGSPWDKVYDEMKNNVITRDSMKEYFTKNDDLETMELSINKEISSSGYYTINVTWDKEAGVWTAVSEDVPGLVLESDSYDKLLINVRLAVRELVKLNNIPQKRYLYFNTNEFRETVDG